MQHEWVGQSAALGDDALQRHVFDTAYLADGPGAGAELDLSDDARPVQWPLDLEREARRLSVCETGAGLLLDVAKWLRGEPPWRPRSFGCNSRLCPVCARVRAARACGRWRPVLEAACADGAVLRHWTFTQEALMEPGGLVTDAEQRKGWSGTLARDGVRCRAVGGEGLGTAYRRFRLAMKRVREHRSTRDLWRESLGGYLVGCEWTGHSRYKPWNPRWHVHGHFLACTPAGVEVDEDAVIWAWCRVAGSSPSAQHVRIVDASAVVEVLKYPFKPNDVTTAQRLESLAYMRGMHPHHVSGSWAPQSNARRNEPEWTRWLEARTEPPEYLRLHHIPNTEGAVPELWTGSPSTGRTVWAVRRSDSKTVDNPTARGWRVWECDADGYAALLGEDPELGGVPPDLGPGADRDEDWFEADGAAIAV